MASLVLLPGAEARTARHRHLLLESGLHETVHGGMGRERWDFYFCFY